MNRPTCSTRNGARPSITSAPSSISYGNTFTCTTPDAANISSVVLVRNGTVTHAFGMDQREVEMSFTAGSGALTVTAPPDGNIAPPGYYMLFILKFWRTFSGNVRSADRDDSTARFLNIGDTIFPDRSSSKRHELYRKRNTLQWIHRKRNFQRKWVAVRRDCQLQSELSFRFGVLHHDHKHFEFDSRWDLPAYDNWHQRYAQSLHTSDSGCGGFHHFSFSKQPDCASGFKDNVHRDHHGFGSIFCHGEFQRDADYRGAPARPLTPRL